jgi:hypothetical protein
VNTVMNCGVPQNAGNCLTSWRTASFSRTVLRGVRYASSARECPGTVFSKLSHEVISEVTCSGWLARSHGAQALNSRCPRMSAWNTARCQLHTVCHCLLHMSAFSCGSS